MDSKSEMGMEMEAELGGRGEGVIWEVEANMRRRAGEKRPPWPCLRRQKGRGWQGESCHLQAHSHSHGDGEVQVEMEKEEM